MPRLILLTVDGGLGTLFRSFDSAIVDLQIYPLNPLIAQFRPAQFPGGA